MPQRIRLSLLPIDLAFRSPAECLAFRLEIVWLDGFKSCRCCATRYSVIAAAEGRFESDLGSEELMVPQDALWKLRNQNR